MVRLTLAQGIDAFYKETYDLRLKKNNDWDYFWSLVGPKPDNNDDLKLWRRRFYEIINAIDSVKDGADSALAAHVFVTTQNEGKDYNGVDNKLPVVYGGKGGTLPSKKWFLTAARNLILKNTRRTSFTKLNGASHHKDINCENSHYDCGSKPDSLAYRLDNGEKMDPIEITSEGHLIDTGPGKKKKHKFSITYDGNYGTQGNELYGEGLGKDVLESLGYYDSALKFARPTSSQCELFRLYGETYPANTGITTFALGNDKKNVFVKGLTGSVGENKKGAYLYYKSLGDKLIYWGNHCHGRDNNSCVFTCDLCLAFFAYITKDLFTITLSDDEEDKEKKITMILHHNPRETNSGTGQGGREIRDAPEQIFDALKETIKAEYVDQISALESIQREQKPLNFSGVPMSQPYNDGFISNLINLFEEYRDEVDLLPHDINDKSHTKLKRYNIEKITKPHTLFGNMFKTSAKRVCIMHTDGFKNLGPKLTLYDYYKTFKGQVGGGVDLSIFPFLKEEIDFEITHQEIVLRKRVKDLVKGVYSSYDPEKQKKICDYFPKPYPWLNPSKYKILEKIPAVREIPGAVRAIPGAAVKAIPKAVRAIPNAFRAIPDAVRAIPDAVREIPNPVRDLQPKSLLSDAKIKCGNVCDETGKQCTRLCKKYYDDDSIYDFLTFYFFADAYYADDYITNLVKAIFESVVLDNTGSVVSDTGSVVSDNTGLPITATFVNNSLANNYSYKISNNLIVVNSVSNNDPKIDISSDSEYGREEVKKTDIYDLYVAGEDTKEKRRSFPEEAFRRVFYKRNVNPLSEATTAPDAALAGNDAALAGNSGKESDPFLRPGSPDHRPGSPDLRRRSSSGQNSGQEIGGMRRTRKYKNNTRNHKNNSVTNTKSMQQTKRKIFSKGKRKQLTRKNK